MSHGPTATEARHLRTLFAVGAAGVLTDGQLLERFANRDGDPAELAFAALVERHGSMVLRVARGVSLDEHSAHDAFQATFLILARKARSLWVRDSLGPWLHSVAFRVASHARSMESRRRGREKAVARPEPYHPHDTDRADLIRAIHQEIDRLPQPFRLAVIACHLEGLTQQDAAERLGWPIGTLQSRLARGRQKLRNRLERRGLNPSLAILAAPMTSVPHILTTATAKAAVSLYVGKAITGTIAPTVLAMIQTTTKGMLMTKLKIGAAGVLMALGGIVGTGMATGLGRPAQPTDEPKSASTVVAPRVHLPPMTGSKTDEPIPLPVENSLDVALLYFHNSDPEWNQTMKPVLESLLHNGYTVKSVDIQRFPSYREKFKIESVPSYVLLVDGDSFRQTEGFKTASELARFYNDPFDLKPAVEGSVSKPTEKPSGVLKPKPSVELAEENQQKSDPSEPGLRSPEPRPWETVVQVTLPDEDEPKRRFSGTLIQGPGSNLIVVTSASNFSKQKNVYWAGTGSYQGKILVNFFDGQLRMTKPPGVRQLPRSAANGSLLDIDYDLNIALIWIDASVNERPEQVRAATFVRENWIPQNEMEMTTVGCSEEGIATAWNTTIFNAQYNEPESDNPKETGEIVCRFEPKPGRIGGGLFNAQGDLVGVCLSADTKDHMGIYAKPQSIRRLLIRAPIDHEFKRNWTDNLEAWYEAPKTEPPATVKSLEPIPAKATSKWQPRPVVEGSPHEPLLIPSPVEDSPRGPQVIPPPAEGPGFPILLDFHATWSAPCKQMRPDIAFLAQSGYPIKTIDIDHSSGLARQFKVTAIPTFILVDGSGNELARRQGQATLQELARFYNENRPKPPEPEPEPATLEPVPDQEPGLILSDGNPKPWETVVRIKMHLSDKEWGFGSGTVISSTPEESIILTCGHIFRLKGQPQPAPKDFKVPITVDLFNGQLVSRAPAQVGRDQQDLVGEAIDYDFDNDVGLIRIRPGKKLPVSRVVPSRWKPIKGTKMYTVGCSHGEDATAWDTKILDPKVTMSNSATKKTFFEIKCAHQPKEGRTGGGLFTTDGYVAGVCNFADPNEHVGLYAVPEAIHELLDRNGLSSLYRENKVADVDIHGFKYPAPADFLSRAGHEPSKPNAAEPILTNPKATEQSRIDDLEKKLNQVLKALEDLKGKAKPE